MELKLPLEPGGLYALTEEDESLAGTARGIYLRTAAAEALDVSEADLLRVEKQGFYVYYHGFVAKPESVRVPIELQESQHPQSSRAASKSQQSFAALGQYFFVNGRYVEDETLARATAAAFSGLIEKGETPLCCLLLTIKPYRLDELEVKGRNVVKFYDPVNVGAFCRDAVSEALLENGYRAKPTARGRW